MKPFLRWAGSKRQLLSVIESHWNKKVFERYVEPFAGSASVFFALEPDKAVLADVNRDLINTLTCVRDNCEELILLLDGLPPSCKDTFLTLRALDPDSITKPQSAARFIYLNRFCFNGLYRTNLRGQFNVPFSAVKTGKLPAASTLRHCSSLLQGKTLLHQPFEMTVESTGSGDFIYLDPPYLDASRRMFREYSAGGFTNLMLSDLRQRLVDLSNRGASFVLSFTESDEGLYLAKDFIKQNVCVSRSIAGNSSFRKSVDELLIRNF